MNFIFGTKIMQHTNLGFNFQSTEVNKAPFVFMGCVSFLSEYISLNGFKAQANVSKDHFAFRLVSSIR